VGKLQEVSLRRVISGKPEEYIRAHRGIRHLRPQYAQGGN